MTHIRSAFHLGGKRGGKAGQGESGTGKAGQDRESGGKAGQTE